MVNGAAGLSGFDGVYSSGVKFCAEGKRVGYIATKKDKLYIVLDGKAYGPFDNMSTEGLSFSPKCKHASVAIFSAEKWHQWIDGELGPAYDSLVIQPPPAYSEDESRIAYGAKRGSRWVVVSGTKEIDAGNNIHSTGIGFLNTGEIYFASIISDKEVQLHIGDGVGEPFEGLYPPGITLSPDRHNLAYAIIRKGYNFHCINLACRPQAFEYFGIGLHVPEGLFGPTFWKNVTLESVLNIAMMGQGSVSVIQHGTPGRWVFYGSTVFSPDGQHYAYVGYNGGSKIYLDGIETASVPTPARVDYLQFSANSDVLVYRTSNANATSAVPIPGTKQFLGSSVGDASAATLTITTKQPYALVYLNDQFVGVAPQTIRVPSGIKRVELQRRGYKSQNVSLSAKPGSTQSVELDLEPLPMRKAIESVLDPSRNSNILLPTDAKSDDIIKGRILVKAPFDEEILGALRLRGDNAVLFGETGIYIHNERSSQSNDPHRFFVPYTVFADSVEPVEHPSFEIAVTGDAVALISSLGLGFMDRGRALMGELRKALSTRKEDSNCLGCQAH